MGRPAQTHVARGGIEKVVMAAYQDPLHLKGGEGVAVLTLCESLVAAGLDVTLVTPSLEGETLGPRRYTRFDGELQVVQLRQERLAPSMYGLDARSRRARSSFADAAVACICKEFPPDGAYVHLHGGFPELPQCARTLRRCGFRVLSTLHMLVSRRAKELGESAQVVEGLRLCEADAILANSSLIVHSHRMADGVLDVCPQYRGSLTVLPCAIGAANFTTPRGQCCDEPLVVAYGRVAKEKGFEVFLEAADIVTRRRRDLGKTEARFLLFGKTDPAIPARRAYADNLLELARRCSNVTAELTPSGIWRGERIALIDRASVGVVPSVYEPYGLVTAEFMARGVPVVATLTQGTEDLLEASGLGPTPYGIVAATAEGLADAVECLLDRPDLARQMGASALRKAFAAFRPESLAQATIAVYHQTSRSSPEEEVLPCSR